MLSSLAVTRRSRCPVIRHGLKAALLLGVPGFVWAQASPFMTGATSLQTNILILRCSGSENGGTSQFASKLIGEREIVRRQIARGRDRAGLFTAGGLRRSTNVSEQTVTEVAVLPSELERLPDLRGYFKKASSPEWFKVSLAPPARGHAT
jgi:hypothetical protein